MSDERSLNRAWVCRLVRALELPAGEYAVCGSAVLAAHGLRDAGDIDPIVSRALYQRLRTAGWTEQRFDTPGRPRALFHGPFDAGDRWSVGDYDPDPAALIATAEPIDGVPFVPLAALAAWKRACGRPKDLADVDLIAGALDLPVEDARPDVA